MIGLVKHPLARSTGWMFVGYVFRLVFQFAAFVWLARILGVTEFGSLATLLAIVALITPFIELGNYSLIVNDVARGIQVARTVGNSLLLMFLTVPIGFIVLALAHSLLFPQLPLGYLVGVAIAELIGGRLLTIAAGVNVAQSQLWRNAIIEALAGLSRLLFVYMLFRLDGSLSTWVSLLAAHGLLVGTAALFWVIQTWGWPSVSFGEFVLRLKPGMHFALGAAAQNAYTDLDKAMLGRMSSFESVGIYAAAHRITLVSYLPLNALLATTYPRFFELGQQSFAATRAYGLKVLRLTLVYGLLVSLFLWLAAPLLPRLLGDDFSQSVKALRWLAIVPLIQSMYFPLGDILTGTGHQVWRSAAQMASLLMNVVLNILWIPDFGWLGSVWATLVSGFTLLLLIMLFILCANHKDNVELRKK